MPLRTSRRSTRAPISDIPRPARGTTSVGAPPAVPALQSSGGVPASGSGTSPTLDENLKGLNRSNQERQIDRLQKRYGQEGQPQGVQVEKAY